MANYDYGSAFRRRRKVHRKPAGKLTEGFPYYNARPDNWHVPFSPYIQAGGEIEKVPVMLFSIRWMYDMAYASDLLRTIIRTLTGETFKNGIEVKERFKAKCEVCEREFEEDIFICPFDGSVTRRPNFEEYKHLKAIIDTKNQFDESFIRVLKEVDNDVNITDNGYIYFDKDYYYDQDQNIVGAEVKRILRLSTEKMRIIVTSFGVGRGEMGEAFFTCPIDRQELVIVNKDDYTNGFIPRCPICNGECIKATYGARENDQPIYFGQEEVYHMKRWSNTQGYGVPPLYSIYLKVLSLLKMDRFIEEAYSLQRSPQGLLIIKGRGENVRGSWEYLMQKARENPNMIYPLVLEGEEDTKRIAEYIEFSLKPQEMQWVEMRREFRETVGAVYGVQPIFVEGSTGQGLSNEGLQITATAQTINDSQRVWNQFLEILSKEMGATDFYFRLYSNELEDEIKKLDIAAKRLELAKAVEDLGLKIRLKRDSNGVLDFDYVRDEKEDQQDEEDDDTREEEDNESQPRGEMASDDLTSPEQQSEGKFNSQ